MLTFFCLSWLAQFKSLSLILKLLILPNKHSNPLPRLCLHHQSNALTVFDPFNEYEWECWIKSTAADQWMQKKMLNYNKFCNELMLMLINVCSFYLKALLPAKRIYKFSIQFKNSIGIWSNNSLTNYAIFLLLAMQWSQRI